MLKNIREFRTDVNRQIIRRKILETIYKSIFFLPRLSNYCVAMAKLLLIWCKFINVLLRITWQVQYRFSHNNGNDFLNNSDLSLKSSPSQTTRYCPALFDILVGWLLMLIFCAITNMKVLNSAWSIHWRDAYWILRHDSSCFGSIISIALMQWIS